MIAKPHEDTDSLYRLSFMLTADREKAERCFNAPLFAKVLGAMP